jgi:hypothetical protein
MKYLFLIALLISIPAIAPTFACEEHHQAMNELEATIARNGAPHAPQPVAPGIEAAPFAKALATEGEVQSFAQTSTFGGGRVFETEFHGERLLIVYRGYTSGVKSSDVGVYVNRDGLWTLVKSHPPVMNAWIEADNNGEDIIFHPEDNPRPVMVLSRVDLPQK